MVDFYILLKEKMYNKYVEMFIIIKLILLQLLTLKLMIMSELLYKKDPICIKED